MSVLKRSVAATAALLALLGAGWGAAVAEPGDPTPTVPAQDGALQQTIDPDQDVATDEVVLEQGHVDLGPRHVGGEWSLLVHDDTRVEGSVWRPLDKTVVRVRDAAIQEIPDDPAYAFLGVEPGTGVHVIPQTQDPDVVWFGWNTQDPSVLQSVDRGVTLALQAVDGPGHLVVYLQDGGFGDPDVLWDSRDEGSQGFWVDVNTHTHANWVFSEAGVYLVSITAAAALVGGTETTTTGTLRLAVGDETDVDAAARATPSAGTSPSTDSAESATSTPVDDAAAGGPPGWVWLVAAIAVLLVVALSAAVLRGRRSRSRALAVREGEQ